LTHTEPARIALASLCALLTSRVHTPLPRPNMVEFARPTRSSPSLNEIAEITGPKISSCAMRMLSLTLANTVGGTK
jgi:hypothetical protein